MPQHRPALAIRTHVTLADVAAFLSHYDEGTPTALSPIERGTVNSSYEVKLPAGRIFLRIYEEQDHRGARAEAERLAYLAERGVLTPAPLARHEGGFVGELRRKPAAAFPWRPGDMRCLRGVSPEDGKRVGRALGKLHAAGQGAPRALGRFEPSDLFIRLESISRGRDSSLASQAPFLRERLGFWTAKRDPHLPRGLIHGDLFRDNVLWTEQGEISALLDFESASDGTFAYDVMVTVLAWAFKDTLDEAIARSIMDGYLSERPLSDAERDGLLAEGAVAAIRFSVTRITDEAMRAFDDGRPPRFDKDFRRFLQRLANLEGLGEKGLAQALFR
jgi:homoserine kinase type II